ncbi:helix-turn-helix domain-containing protein [Candidatus Pacearchaeota archaeon]|nr:helix-turn-helix domain-containing protein [Candidatus Pacearchaeota archaeon]
MNDVHEIRQRYSKGEIFQRELAKEYNVSSSTICKIINNKLWKE